MLVFYLADSYSWQRIDCTSSNKQFHIQYPTHLTGYWKKICQILMSRFSFEFFEGVRGKGQPKVRGGVKAARIVERLLLSTNGVGEGSRWQAVLASPPARAGGWWCGYLQQLQHGWPDTAGDGWGAARVLEDIGAGWSAVKHDQHGRCGCEKCGNAVPRKKTNPYARRGKEASEPSCGAGFFTVCNSQNKLYKLGPF